MSKNKGIVLGSFILACLMLGSGVNAAAITKHQSSNAIVKSKIKQHIVNNKNLSVHNKKGYTSGVPLDFISSKKGDAPMVFATRLSLPTNWQAPESIAMTNDGKQAYVLYNANGDYTHKSMASFIVKYDLSKNKFNINPNNNSFKIGPTFNSGAVKSLAYNSKNHQLLVNSQVKGQQMQAQQISLSTLKPTNELNYKVSQPGVKFNSAVTFDHSGNAYIIGKHKQGLYVYSGKLSASRARFKQMSSIIKHASGNDNKGLAYDNRTKRLMVMADDSLMSFPTKHFNKLTPAKFKNTVFNSRREFRGVTFDNAGEAFLLVNRSPEIMRSTYLK